MGVDFHCNRNYDHKITVEGGAYGLKAAGWKIHAWKINPEGVSHDYSEYFILCPDCFAELEAQRDGVPQHKEGETRMTELNHELKDEIKGQVSDKKADWPGIRGHMPGSDANVIDFESFFETNFPRIRKGEELQHAIPNLIGYTMELRARVQALEIMVSRLLDKSDDTAVSETGEELPTEYDMSGSV